MVTGIWFHTSHWKNEIFAPSSIAVGMRNMFTTACSKPIA